MANTEATAFIERLLKKAGIGPGQRVLDLGCGGGAVSRLAAELVGPEGEVLGVDRQARALARAQALTEEAGLKNVSFIEHDLSEALPGTEPFDAVIARRVLMYLPEPEAALKHAFTALKSGGVVAFQEMNATGTPLRSGDFTLHDQVNGWIWQTIEKEGGHLDIGLTLPAMLRRCGFSVEYVGADAEVEGFSGSMVPIVRAIVPRIAHHLKLSEEELGLDTLQQRLDEERDRADSVYVRNLTFGIWAQKPGV